MTPQDLTQPFASRVPAPLPMIPTSPSRSAFLQQPPKPIIPTTGAARFWYVDPTPAKLNLVDQIAAQGPGRTAFAFSKGGRPKDSIHALLAPDEVVLTPAQQKKVGIKRIKAAIGNKHGTPIDGGAYGFQEGGEVRPQPYLNMQPANQSSFKMGSSILDSGFKVAGDRSELNDMLNQSPETQFLSKPQPTPTPTPPQNVTPKMVDGWTKMYGWGIS